MRLAFGFVLLFILSVAFSYWQGFIDFLINLGVFPEQFKDSSNFDIVMIFVTYVLFMLTAFAVVGIMSLYSGTLDAKLKWNIKRAKKESLKKYGTTSPYFYFMDPKAPDVHHDKLNYVYETYTAYLYEKYQDWDKVEQVNNSLSEMECLKLYHEAIEYFGLPDIPKEYGIFEGYSEKALAAIQR